MKHLFIDKTGDADYYLLPVYLVTIMPFATKNTIEVSDEFAARCGAIEDAEFRKRLGERARTIDERTSRATPAAVSCPTCRTPLRLFVDLAPADVVAISEPVQVRPPTTDPKTESGVDNS